MLPQAERDPLYQQAIGELRDLLAEAQASADPEPSAMTLATADADGRVSARIVLLKGVDADGLRFFTNYDSAKGRQLAAHPQAALTLHWKFVREQVQVRAEGLVRRLDAAASDAYFATRPRMSQLGAWASLQSQPLPERAVFEQRLAEAERRFADGEVSRPPNWGGYVLEPDRLEFWYGAGFRLHERVCYRRDGEGRWSRGLLYP